MNAPELAKGEFICVPVWSMRQRSRLQGAETRGWIRGGHTGDEVLSRSAEGDGLAGETQVGRTGRD